MHTLRGGRARSETTRDITQFSVPILRGKEGEDVLAIVFYIFIFFFFFSWTGVREQFLLNEVDDAPNARSSVLI